MIEADDDGDKNELPLPVAVASLAGMALFAMVTANAAMGTATNDAVCAMTLGKRFQGITDYHLTGLS